MILLLAITGTTLAVTHVGNVAGLVGTSLRASAPRQARAAGAHSRAGRGESLRSSGPSRRRRADGRASGDAPTRGIRPRGGDPGAGDRRDRRRDERHAAGPLTSRRLWPFTIRLSFAALEGRADEAARALIGSQIGVIGLLALIAGIAMRAWRLPLAMLALALLGAGAGLALPPLAIDAYPTTYLRPSVRLPGRRDHRRRRALPDELRGLPRAAGSGRRPRRPRAPAVAGRPARAAHRAAHGGRSLLVDQPRDLGIRDARIRLAARRGATLGADQLPARAVGRLRRPRHGTHDRARPALARRTRLHVHGRPDAGARAQGLSRPQRAGRALRPARLARAA